MSEQQGQIGRVQKQLLRRRLGGRHLPVGWYFGVCAVQCGSGTCMHGCVALLQRSLMVSEKYSLPSINVHLWYVHMLKPFRVGASSGPNPYALNPVF